MAKKWRRRGGREDREGEVREENENPMNVGQPGQAIRAWLPLRYSGRCRIL